MNNIFLLDVNSEEALQAKKAEEPTVLNPPPTSNSHDFWNPHNDLNNDDPSGSENFLNLDEHSGQNNFFSDYNNLFNNGPFNNDPFNLFD